MKDGDKNDKRARARALASEFAARGDSLGWFDELYKESSGDNGLIPWADLEPNQFFKSWAERNGLTGGGRKALVVGCGLGDDAAYLDDLGFKVTAFDISQTAIEWARRLHEDRDIQFEVADLFSLRRPGVAKNQSLPPGVLPAAAASILCWRYIPYSPCRWKCVRRLSMRLPRSPRPKAS